MADVFGAHSSQHFLPNRGIDFSNLITIYTSIGISTASLAVFNFGHCSRHLFIIASTDRILFCTCLLKLRFLKMDDGGHRENGRHKPVQGQVN